MSFAPTDAAVIPPAPPSMRRLLALVPLAVAACSSVAPSIDPRRSTVENTSPLTGDCRQQLQRPFFEYQVEGPARFIADSLLIGAGTWYPTAAAPRGDTVSVQFIVDAEGRPEAGTLRILKAPNAELGATLFGEFQRWRYAPARLGGCPVRQLVQTNLTRGR